MNTYRQSVRRLLVPSLAVFLLATAARSHADESADAAITGQQGRVLEEIIVTAQKRVESLQDVPISASVTSGAEIEKANIINLEELSFATPNLFIAENPFGNFIYIRGIGSQTNQSIEQSVAVYSDGIYRGRMHQSRAPFMDLERIEVLRGPQSILFGKNTIGGAISISTASPGPETEAQVSLLYGGEYDEREANAFWSGPLTDTLGMRVAVRDYQVDGFLENTVTGSDDPERDEQTARIVLQWQANEHISIRLRHEHSDFDSVGRSTQGITRFPFDDQREVANDGGRSLQPADINPALLADLGSVDAYINAYNLQLFDGEYSNIQLKETVLRMDIDLGGHTLTAISGYSGYDYNERLDADFSPLPTIQVDTRERFDQLSQEIRLLSPGGQTIDYITGIYVQKTELEFAEDDQFAANLAAGDLIPPELQAIISPAAIPNLSRPSTFDQKSETLAFFVQATWNISPVFRATVGMRYTREKKDARQSVWVRDFLGDDIDCSNPPDLLTALGGGAALDLAIRCQLGNGYLNEQIRNSFPALAPAVQGLLSLGTWEHDYEASRTEGQWTPSLILQWDANDNTMLYFSVAEGFKGGGFDARILLDTANAEALGVNFEFEDEQATSVEIGSKMRLGQRAEMNVALFVTEIEDLQVSLFDGRTGFVVGNAAQLRSQGAEIESRFQINDVLGVEASLAWLDARFTDYENGGCTAAMFLEHEAATGSRLGCRQDLSDKPTFLAPEWTANLALLVSSPLSDTLFFDARLDLNFRDDFYLDADNEAGLVQGAYTLVNLQLGLSPANENWRIALIGKNLTDRLYSTQGTDIPLTDGEFYKMTGPPRSVAVQGTWNF